MQGETTLTLGAEHPVFVGHFPGQPIVPGVLLIDAVLHAVAQAHRAAGETTTSGRAVRCEIASAKFLSPVQPGETLAISWTTNGLGQTRFDIASSGRAVASGTFVFERAA